MFVLILVVVDDGLVRCVIRQIENRLPSLNPYCSG